MYSLSNLNKVLCNHESTKAGKFKVLAEFFNNAHDDEKELFRLYLDKTSASNIGPSTVERAIEIQHCTGPTTFTPLDVYKKFESGEVSGSNAVVLLAAILSTLPTSEMIAFQMVLLKTPCGFSYKTVNDYYMSRHGKNFVDCFQVQLSNKYLIGKNYNCDRFIASPKMDGLRCYFKAEDLTMYTRNNLVHKPLAEIQQICTALVQKFNLSLLDGELYTHNVKFEALSGLIRSEKAGSVMKQDIRYIIFAALPVGDLSGFTTLRMTMLMHDIKAWLTMIDTQRVSIVYTTVIDNNFQSIKTATESFVELGYEGIMLRSYVTPYDFKRSNCLLKYKLFIESDFTIIDFKEGAGKYEGMLGSIVVKEGNIQADVGSGFTDEERSFIWSIRTQLVGKRIEVKYQGLTDKSLRFPTFSKFK